ncbi:PREDICTED: E3 ubiquitin-protein ligase SDIR1-like [Fragaria vesca subsp. vesca]
MMSKELGYIQFDVWKIIDGTHHVNQLDFTFDHSVVKPLSHGTMLTRDLRTMLSMIGVPEDRQPGVVDQILKVLQVSVPMLPIDVSILEQIYNVFPPVSPAARLEPDVKLATESLIEGLAKVSLEEPPESPCTICFDGLAYQLIARMPCSHRFHANCIVRWLIINHLCPLCRYPMRIKKQGQV